MLEGSLGGHGRALGRLLRAGDHALAGEGEGLGKSSHGDGVPWNDAPDKKALGFVPRMPTGHENGFPCVVVGRSDTGRLAGIGHTHRPPLESRKSHEKDAKDEAASNPRAVGARVEEPRKMPRHCCDYCETTLTHDSVRPREFASCVKNPPGLDPQIRPRPSRISD